MNNKGFTLVETIIAGSLIIVVVMIAVSAMLLFGRTASFVKHSAETDENVRTVDAALNDYLAKAINVVWTGAQIGNPNNGAGQFRIFSSELRTGNPPPVAIAVFIREMGRAVQGAPQSMLRASGIYFREPTAKNPGVLSFSTSLEASGAVNVSSANALDRFDQIVDFRLEPSGYPVGAGESVRVVKATVVFRKFLDQDRNTWRWCPSSRIATVKACQSTASFKDVTLITHIPLVNNMVTTDRYDFVGGRVSETLFGSLYYFKLGMAVQ